MLWAASYLVSVRGTDGATAAAFASLFVLGITAGRFLTGLVAERIGDPWGDLEKVQVTARDLYLPYRQLEANAGGGSTLYSYARAIVRASKERAKPVAERRAGYADSDIAALGRRLASEAPIPVSDRTSCAR